MNVSTVLLHTQKSNRSNEVEVKTRPRWIPTTNRFIVPTMLTNKRVHGHFDVDVDVGVDVILLDIDGVLLPFGDEQNEEASCSGLFPDRTVAALSKILEHTGALVVLSSTWRVRSNFRQDILTALRVYGEKFGGPLMEISTFHDLTNINTHSERQWELRDWLMANQEKVRSWVALDDEELLEGETNEKYRYLFLGHVVKTKSSIGLTMKDAQIAIKLFKQQQQQQQQKGVNI